MIMLYDFHRLTTSRDPELKNKCFSAFLFIGKNRHKQRKPGTFLF